LNEEERQFFSDPHEKQVLSMIDSPEIADKILDGAERNEIFESWLRRKPGLAHSALQDDGTEIKVTPNISAKEMIERASNANNLGLTQDVFDICDIINKS
jgi:hypothetical protein